MKVILLKNIPKIGNKDDIKEVSQGHAMNFLIPRKLAKPATDKEIIALKNKKQEQQVHEEVRKELIAEVISGLNNKEVILEEKANEKGSLFSQVHIDEIVSAVAHSTKSQIDPSWIQPLDPIKEIGKHEVKLKLDNSEASFNLVIKAKE